MLAILCWNTPSLPEEIAAVLIPLLLVAAILAYGISHYWRARAADMLRVRELAQRLAAGEDDDGEE